MKRNIFIAVLGMSAVAAYGQGQIDFGNYLTGSTDPKVTYALTGVPPGKAGEGVGSGFNAQLLYYVGTSALDKPATPGAMSLLTVGGASPVPFGLSAGGVTDGSKYAGWFEGGAVQIPGVTSANAAFVSFAIEAFNGTSYSSPSTTVAGISSIFQSPTQATSGSAIPGFQPGPWQTSFIVNSVPEPTTLALAGLGGLASLVALRRKQS